MRDSNILEVKSICEVVSQGNKPVKITSHVHQGDEILFSMTKNYEKMEDQRLCTTIATYSMHTYISFIAVEKFKKYKDSKVLIRLEHPLSPLMFDQSTPSNTKIKQMARLFLQTLGKNRKLSVILPELPGGKIFPSSGVKTTTLSDVITSIKAESPGMIDSKVGVIGSLDESILNVWDIPIDSNEPCALICSIIDQINDYLYAMRDIRDVNEDNQKKFNRATQDLLHYIELEPIGENSLNHIRLLKDIRMKRRVSKDELEYVEICTKLMSIRLDSPNEQDNSQGTTRRVLTFKGEMPLIEIVEKIEALLSILLRRKESIPKAIRECEGKTKKLLDRIANDKFSASEGYRLSKDLQSVMKERALARDELAILQTNNLEKVHALAKEVLMEMKTLQENHKQRQYHSRVINKTEAGQLGEIRKFIAHPLSVWREEPELDELLG